MEAQDKSKDRNENSQELQVRVAFEEIQDDTPIENNLPKISITRYPNLLKVIHLAVSFFLLFTAYTTTQSLVTSLFPDYGTYALAILYFCFALGGFISPYVVSRIGIRMALVVASATYTVFILATALRNVYFFLIMSVVMGINAAFLWTSSGLYITWMSEPETRGFYAGVFNGIYSSSGILGSAITGGLLQEISRTTVLYILVGVGCSSVLSFCFLRHAPKPKSEQGEVSVKQKIIGTMKCLVEYQMRFLLLYMFYQGFASGTIFGKVVTLLEFKYIPFFILSYSLAYTLSMFVYGKIYDLYKWVPLVCANVLSAAVGSVLLLIGYYRENIPLLFICSFIFGHQDGVVALLMQSSVMSHFSDKAADAFSVYRTVSSIGAALLLGIGKLLSLLVMQIIVLSMLVVSVVLYVLFQRTAAKVTPIQHLKDDENLTKDEN